MMFESTGAVNMGVIAALDDDLAIAINIKPQIEAGTAEFVAS